MLSEVTLNQMQKFSLTQRTLIFQFLYPNPQPMTDAEWQFFWDLYQEGVIEFADQDTANEHLHVKHEKGEAEYWCTNCAARKVAA